MKKTQYRKCPFVVGTLCLLAAVALALSNHLTDLAAGKRAKAILDDIHAIMQTEDTIADRRMIFDEEPAAEKVEQIVPDYILNPNMEMPKIEIGGNAYIGTLLFPTLDLELPVISSWSYPKLKIAPCLYSGSIYNGSAVIAAHNYTSHFGRLSELGSGDAVSFVDVDGNIFNYKIIVKEVVGPTAINEVVESDFDLTLFTCTISGASRFTVRCRLLEKPWLL